LHLLNINKCNGLRTADGNDNTIDELIPTFWIIAFIKTARRYSHFKPDGGDYIQTVKKAKKISTPIRKNRSSIKPAQYSQAFGKNPARLTFGKKVSLNRL
jgi:hypothetical protein